MLQDRLNTIKQKLLKLKAKDKNLWLFGAKDDAIHNVQGHHYDLQPVLSEETITAKENRAGVTLSEEYKEFLKTIGNGIAGPFWGLYSLEMAMGNDEYIDQNPGFFGTPFPYSTADALKFIELKQKDVNYFPPFTQPITSYVWLSNYGHDMFFILVVGGEQDGKVWFNQDGSTCYPVFNPKTGQQFSFLDWYEDWLDTNLEQGGIPDDPNVPFENPDEIEVINYQRLRLPQVPENIFACKNLKKLIVTENQFQYIPDALCSLEKLEIFNAFFNQIKALPEDIGHLGELREIYLKTNAIEALPESIGQCKKIKFFDMSFNRLTQLPESIGNLEELEYFSLDYNQLQKLPESFKQLQKLKTLILTGNPISDDEKQKIMSMLPTTQVIF